MHIKARANRFIHSQIWRLKRPTLCQAQAKGINVNAVSLLSQSTFFAHEAALQFVL
jgi:hypothetical protein